MRERNVDPRLERLLEEEAGLRRLASRLFGPDVADEAVQTAWLHAIRTPPPTNRNLRGWFWVVVRRLVAQDRLASQRRVRREASVARDEVDAGDDVVSARETNDIVRDAVAALPDRYRDVVREHFFEHRSLVDIAAAHDIPIETVRTRLKRAVARLRLRLRGRLDVPAAGGLVPFAHRWLTRRVAGAAAAAAVLGGVAVTTLLPTPPPMPPETRAARAPTLATPPLVLASTADTTSSGNATPASPNRVPVSSPPRSATRPATDSHDGRLVGVVRGPTGDPVAGATIVAMGMATSSVVVGDPNAVQQLAISRSGADGRFVLAWTGRCRYLSVVARAFAKASPIEPVGDPLVVRLERPVPLSGRVRDEAGRPIADAWVTMLGRAPTILDFGADGGPRRARRPGHVFLDTKTAADGTYSFAMAPPGRFRVAVSTREFGPTVERVVRLRVDERSVVDFVVRTARRAEVAGRVVDAYTRAPLAGVPIRFNRTEAPVAVSDEDGRFAVDAAVGRFVVLHAETVGGVGETALFRVPEDGVFREIGVRSTTTVRGRVIDGNGDPIAGARVFSPDRAASTRTDADGGYALEVARPAAHLHATHAGRGEGAAPVGAGSVEPVDIVLRRGGGVRGRINVEEQIDPRAAFVCLTAVEPLFPPAVLHRAAPDRGGRFAFHDVTPGRYRVSAWVGRQFRRFDAVVHVSAGGFARADLHVSSERSIEGQILDERREPVPSALVRAIGAEGRTERVACADRQGRFRLSDVAGPVELRVTGREGHATRSVPDVRPGAEPIRIALARRDVPRGVVIDTEGRAVTSFWVRTFPHAVRDPGFMWKRHVESDEGRFDLADAGGPIGVPALVDGRYDIEVGTADGRVSRLARDVSVPASGELRFVVREAASIRGIVSDARGRPVAGAQIVIAPVARTAEQHVCYTLGSGRFCVRPLRAGTYRVRVRHFDVGAATVTRAIGVGVHDVAITLADNSGVGIRVLDEAGATLDPGSCWVALRRGKSVLIERTSADGVARFRALLPGPHDVIVSGPAKQRYRGEVTVTRGTNHVVTVRLRRPQRFTSKSVPQR